MSSLMHRAYSLVEVKAFDEERRELTGIASTPRPDRYSDIVEPKGARYELPLPLLWQHSAREPVGHVVKAKPTKEGIDVVMRLAKVDEPGTLKDRLDEAWQSVKASLVRGLSIGFSPIEYTRIAETGGLHFLQWDWLELSLVTIAANADAKLTSKALETLDDSGRIALLRRFDESTQAASGHIELRRPVQLKTARVRAPDGSIKLFTRRS